MIFGLSFGKKKTSSSSSTNTNLTENTNQSQSQSTAGSTQTTSQTSGTTSQNTTGVTSSDQVNRSNQSTTGSTTQTGTTTTLGQGIQDQLESALGGLLSGGFGNENQAAISAASRSLLDFDPVSFVNDSVAAARNRGEQTLQETNSGIANAIGGTAADNTMATLLAQRGSNDLAATLAGVRANATQTAAEIARGNVATAQGVSQGAASTIGAIGDLLKGATTTTSQQSLEEQIAALVGSQTGAQRTNESATGTSTQNQVTSQLIQEIINAISQTNTTKVGTEASTGTEKKGGGGISIGI